MVVVVLDLSCRLSAASAAAVAIPSGVLDSLPHNRYAVTTIRAIYNETHRDAYGPVGALTVFVPALCVLLCLRLFVRWEWGAMVGRNQWSPQGRDVCLVSAGLVITAFGPDPMCKQSGMGQPSPSQAPGGSTFTVSEFLLTPGVECTRLVSRPGVTARLSSRSSVRHFNFSSKS